MRKRLNHNKLLREYITQSDINRFWSKVNIKSEGECWEWKACVNNRSNYGQFWFEGKFIRAHRFSYTASYGDIPDDLLICHKCNNTICVNPKHLYAGTPQDNVNDMINAGHLVHISGEDSKVAKLSNKDVEEIRQLLDTKIAQRRIAEKFHVDESTISRIKHKSRWKTT